MYKSNCKNCGAPLKQHLRECEYCGTENPNFNLLDASCLYADNMIVEKVYRAPDPVELKKLHKYNMIECKCAVCGAKDFGVNLPRYCPYCGADMR